MTRWAVAAIPLVLIPALGGLQGGFHPSTWVWSGALAAWAAALGLVLGEGSYGLRRHWPWLVAGAALVLWTLASTLWSQEPHQSLLEARRTLLYAAVVLALVVLARRNSGRALLAGTHLAISALVLYALAHYLLGARPFAEFEGHLLSEPLGYANAVGILAALGVILSLGAVMDRAPIYVRVAAAALVPLLALALELSGSDASWLALAVGLATMAALSTRPLAFGRTLVAIVPAAAVAVLVGRYSDLASLSTPRLAGTTVALIAAGCAIGAGLLTAWSTSGASRRPRRRWHPLVIASIAAVVGLATLAIALAGAPQPRSSYYHVAWRDYLAHPLLGSGAGTFGRYWLSWGDVIRWGGALDAHSLYLETLAELGPIGLCLLAAFLLYPLGRAIRRGTLPLVPAAAGATVAFLVHAGLDWDWELPAVVLAGLSCAAVVAFAEPDGESDEPSPPLPPVARAVALAAALLAGAAAIAGARSTVEPSATSSRTTEAPQSGASVVNRVKERSRYL